jgi:hypothetical protein
MDRVLRLELRRREMRVYLMLTVTIDIGPSLEVQNLRFDPTTVLIEPADFAPPTALRSKLNAVFDLSKAGQAVPGFIPDVLVDNLLRALKEPAPPRDPIVVLLSDDDG